MTERKRALLSVSDKRGIYELARELSELGYEIVSTGGTAKTIREGGVKVTEASEVTGFPEILGGRVKTLHPYIHGGILARSNQAKELKEHGIVPIDLVVVNLYPFIQTVAREGVTPEEAIENIDIGGPSMIRAAAKNHERVAVLVNPERYDETVAEIKKNGRISKETRARLAGEAFAHTAEYDAAIAAYFEGLQKGEIWDYPDNMLLSLSKVQDLRYGENPQQKAAFYRSSGEATGLAAMHKLQGKELSFNNLNDLNAARELVLEFTEPTAVAVKHANPCGVGSAEILAEAYQLAYEGDPVSIFGGVLALNRPVDADTAREMIKIFIEVIAAPAFSKEALDILAAKKDIRLLEMDLKNDREGEGDLKKVAGGVLVQTVDREPVDVKRGKVVTKRAPTEEEWDALNFAQTVVKHVRSNAIVLAGRGRTFGIGAGQTSRIGAARIALEQAGEKAKGAVLGSDAFFPFPDTVETAAAAGVTAIVQPGGSLKDADSIALCERLGLTMVFTGRRHFKH
ncbi:MAG: bifunctional phosphoribosylaminoimidazolecarboxamide formyltransferase/inosine monophosphate cyclohydrolase [Firmicutes bacterium ML8_F2]|nr:MAG: bifunctional phosphoribosylaminoimidazolecarboxamide formyltransferase/inosine monophosphate cyclohydrolase [Firmicutes bacterium ML8_F2]